MASDIQVAQFQPALAVPADTVEAVKPVRWSLATRIAFRMCFIYFTLFSISNQIIGGLIVIPKLNLPDFGTIWPLRQITFWTAKHIFHVTYQLVYTGSGSGDKTYDWVQAFCIFVISIAATIIWSILDSRRENYVSLYRWFRLYIRFCLASEMFLYGLDKLIPLQMPFPSLSRLMEPYGNFAPMSVLWYSIGASKSYEIFAGCAECVGGLLLLVPRITTLGALVCMVDMIQVFMLNMTYDVPVKLFAFHLILLAVLLLTPDMNRLRIFFFSKREAPASNDPQLFRKPRANRIAIALQIIFGLYLFGYGLYGAIDGWRQFGGGSPKPELYGIWDVSQMSIDGQLRSPILGDYDRWRRVMFDVFNATSFERMDDTYARYSAAVDPKAKSIALTKGSDKNWKATLAYERPAQDQLVLDGTMDGHKVHMNLKLLDRSKLMIVSRGFHWISEYPFQR